MFSKFPLHEKCLLPSDQSQRGISLQSFTGISAVVAFFPYFLRRCLVVLGTFWCFFYFCFVFFHKDYLSLLFSIEQPHTTYNLRHLLAIVLSTFQELSLSGESRPGKLFYKMASSKMIIRCGMARMYSSDQRFLLLVQDPSMPWFIFRL